LGQRNGFEQSKILGVEPKPTKLTAAESESENFFLFLLSRGSHAECLLYLILALLLPLQLLTEQPAPPKKTLKRFSLLA